jgi:hypothetical protein
MKNRFAVLAVVASLVGAAPLATPVADASGPSAVAAACKNAKIGGQSKCIGRGQFCAKRFERDYNRYGFTCSKRDRNGRWHLQ